MYTTFTLMMYNNWSDYESSKSNTDFYSDSQEHE